MGKQNKKRGRFLFLSFVIAFSSFLCTLGGFDLAVGNSISVFENEPLSLPAYAESDYKNTATGFTFDEQATIEVFGIDIKNISVDVFKDVRLYPGGMAFGVKMSTQGVMIVGINSVSGSLEKSPANLAGLKIGDMILKINGIEIKDAKSMSEIIEKSNGEQLTVIYSRSGKEEQTKITPVKDPNDGHFKTGIWVRDNTAGIGTVTYIEPETGRFGGLGHGICDLDTGNLLPLREGEVSNVIINGVTKGKGGIPGELRGFFDGGKTGSVYRNTNCGIYGIFDSFDSGEMQTLPIALKRDIKEGPAEIICTTSENAPTRYNIEIVKLVSQSTETKNFIIKITDERLLEKTGGIVQGMSGSPIIQNGKLIGAVTHVLINDPTRGYGIFIENMLKSAKID